MLYCDFEGDCTDRMSLSLTQKKKKRLEFSCWFLNFEEKWVISLFCEFVLWSQGIL